jgi:hypothetical protein
MYFRYGDWIGTRKMIYDFFFQVYGDVIDEINTKTTPDHVSEIVRERTLKISST